MYLSRLIKSIVIKRLSSTEIPDLGSHQHELNGVTALREFFGTDEDTAGTMRWLLMRSDGEMRVEESEFRFYDARANNPDRTEWRMYYSGEFLSHASPGDLLIIIRSASNQYYALVSPWESPWLTPILQLLNIDTMQDDLQGLLKAKL